MGERNYSVKVMITCDKSGKSAADEFTEIYRSVFEVVRREFSSFEEAMGAASEMKLTHLLYFKDNKNLILVSLADEMGGYSLDITVDDLKRVLS